MNTKTIFNLFLMLTLSLNVYCQENPCLPLLQQGLYKYVINKTSSSFNGDLKTYFESTTFKDDFKSGDWSFGLSGVIPVGNAGFAKEIGLDIGASEEEINSFQQQIKESKAIKINDDFYRSSVTSIPDVGLAKAYVDCLDQDGFSLVNVISTNESVVLKIKYTKRMSSDPLPIVKNFEILGSNSIIQGLKKGESIQDEFSISCQRYPENELIVSINTDRENFVYIIEAENVGFNKEFPIGTILTSVLDWDSFSQITSGKTAGEWDAANSKWAPADGRGVSASKYSRKSGKNEVPDLRGVFLRGLNMFDPFYQDEVATSQKDPDNRAAGSFQTDALKSHSHTFNTRGNGENAGGQGYPAISDNPNNHIGTKATTDNSPNLSTETRPKNVAVFYYVKIN